MNGFWRIAFLLFLVGCKNPLGDNSRSDQDFHPGLPGTQPTVSSLDISNNVLTLQGTGLSDVTSVQITGSGVNATFTPISQSSTQLSATVSSAVSLTLGTLYTLLVSNAYVASFPITFTLSSGSVTPAMLDRSYVQLTGDTMTGALNVGGLIQSTSGGFKFPDGSTQTTAASTNCFGGTCAGNTTFSGNETFSGTVTATNTVQLKGGAGNIGLYVDSSGNVGIGTTTPGTITEINGGASSTEVRIVSTGNNAAVRFTGNGTLRGYAGSIAGSYGLFDSSANSAVIIANGPLVGIGTTSPSTLLDVNGTARVKDFHIQSGFVFQFDGNGYMRTSGATLNVADDSTANVVLAAGGGRVGIGAWPATYQLQLSSDSAGKPGTNSWTIASDSRLKDIRAPFTRGLDSINQLHPIYYHYKKGNKLDLPTDKEYVGIIAQDAQTAVPEAVSTDKKGFLHLNNDSVIWTMVNAIKKLYANFVDHGKQIAELKKENSQIKAWACAQSPKPAFCK